jgi:hypothetical protein
MLLAASLACGVSGTPPLQDSSGIATTVAETMAAFPTQESPAADPTFAFEGKSVTFQGGNLVIPDGLATDATQAFIPPASEPDVSPWEVTPGHIELTLDGYVLQDTFHTPKIYIFPAQSDSLSAGAANNIFLIRDILANPAQLLVENNMPPVPFFNAGAVLVAKDEPLDFQNGAGVRMLTQYAQSFAKINNKELFYHFQGLSDDQSMYIIAILPVSAATLPADSAEGSAPASGGVTFPGYADPNADFEGYYAAVKDELNRLTPEAFNPSLTSLDALVASLQVSTP